MSFYKRHPVRLGSALSRFVNKHPQKMEMLQAMVVNDFPKVVGERIAEQCGNVYMRESTLYIHVADASWRQEIFYQRETIRTALNDHMKRNLIRQIRIKG